MNADPDDHIDENAVLDRLGGDRELLASLVAMFHEQWPTMLGDIRRGVDAGDAARAGMGAHTLKSAIGIFSQGSAYALALRLEQMGKAKDLADAGAALAELEAALQRLANSITRLTPQEP